MLLKFGIDIFDSLENVFFGDVVILVIFIFFFIKLSTEKDILNSDGFYLNDLIHIYQNRPYFKFI